MSTPDTRDWDTAYGLRTELVNLSILNKHTNPGRFDIDQPGGILPMIAVGNFGIWQVVGGSGAELHVNVPILNGTLQINGAAGGIFDLAGCSMTLIMFLAYFDQVDGKVQDPDSGNPGTYDLNHNRVSPVSVLQFITVPGSPLAMNPDSDTITGAFVGTLRKWFEANRDLLDHTFSSVDVNTVADANDFQFLKPTCTGYAISANGKVFGVLSMTSKDGATRAKAAGNDISPDLMLPDLIVNGKTIPVPSTLMISAPLFLQKLVLPGLTQGTHAFGPPGSFMPDPEDENGLTNSQDISFNVHTEDHGDYTANVAARGMKLAITGSELVITITDMTVPISPGIWAELELTEKLTLSLIDTVDANGKPTGGKTFNWTQSYYDTHSQVKLGPGVVAAEIIAGIVLSIVATVFAAGGQAALRALGYTISRVAVRVIAAIAEVVGGVIIASPQWMDLANRGKFEHLPDVAAFALSGAKPIHWPDSAKDAVLLSADINGGLRIGIDPKFATTTAPIPPAAPRGLRAIH